MPLDNFKTELTDEQILKAAPSVFATAAAPTVSDKYVYVPSYQIVRDMRNMGFSPVRVREGKKRAPDGRQFALHEIRFRDLREGKSETRAPELGDLTPELILRNSHDRTSGIALDAGIFRLVCLNGMTVADQHFSVRVKHYGNKARELVHEGAGELVNHFGEVIDTCKYWSKIELTDDQMREFAKKAIEARDVTTEIDPTTILTPRRWNDTKPTLWNVFNRAQENFTNGNVWGRRSTGHVRHINRITSLARDVDLNRKLWTAAAEMAESIQPRSNGTPVVKSAASELV